MTNPKIIVKLLARYDNGESITNEILSQSGSKFEWTNSSDSDWEPTYVIDETSNQTIPNQIMVRHSDIDRNSHIRCSVTFDETQFETEETEETEDDETVTEGGASE